MRAFDVLYQGDNKMYHQPYTFLRARADAPWVRIDGILTVGELVKEYRASFQLADAGFN
jgi:protein SCO1/2